MTTQLQKADAFLKERPTCVIARVNGGGGASAATVGFSHDEQFRFLIATNQATRKYQDITHNSKVALVIGFEMPLTVQVEGTAKQMSQEELGDRLEQHFEKVPAARNFAGEEGQSYFLITPNWLWFRNMLNESETFETKEFV